jgi:sulfonate transport system substrate-binding protein
MSLHNNAPAVARRTFLTAVAGMSLGGLAACATGTANPVVLSGPLPTNVPPDTKLSIAIHPTQIQLEASGQIGRLPFAVDNWPNLSAGPDIIQGFRARSIDLASNAGIPPIQAQAIRFDAKIVAVQTRDRPIYTFATAAGSDIRSVADFRGKKIGFSQGQAQGVVVLRALKEVGLSKGDVHLVPLNSTAFPTALQAKQVDVAPLAEPILTKYLTQYERDGARAVQTDVVDLLAILWAPTSVLQDPAKAAAIRAFIPFWTQGQVWAWEHPDQWIDAYYVKDQNLSAADGQRIVTSNAKPVFPRSWDRAIAWEQETADLLTGAGYTPPTQAAGLFDRRFEPIAAGSVSSTYQE